MLINRNKYELSNTVNILVTLKLIGGNRQGCHLSSISKFPDFSLIFPDILQFSIPSDRSKKIIFYFLV